MKTALFIIEIIEMYVIKSLLDNLKHFNAT
jgi:hypothetical protein